MAREGFSTDMQRLAQHDKGRAPRPERNPGMRATRKEDRPIFLRQKEGKREQSPDVVRLVTEEENVDTDVLYEQLTRDFMASFSQDVHGVTGVRFASTKFQNRLLRVLYQKIQGFSIRELQDYILTAVKASSDHSIKGAEDRVPQEFAKYRRGVEETLRYIQEREATFNKESNKGKELVIGTNDGLDAEHKIDVVEAAIGTEGSVEEVRFVQIKAGRFDAREQDTVHKAHEEYVGMLRSSETQERLERTARGPEDLKRFVEKIETGSAAERFDAYGNRYNDLLLECLLVCQKDTGQSGITDEQVDGWLKNIHSSETDVERAVRMTEFSLMLRAQKSQELFRMFAMATGEENIEEVVQRYHLLVRSWALSYTPPMDALRAVTGDYKPDPRWLMRDTVKFTSVYKCQDNVSEQRVIV